MLKLFIKFIFLFAFVSISSLSVEAQIMDCSNLGEDPRDPYPEAVKEKLMEMCIKKAKKDFQELLDRGEEIAKLSEEIELAFSQTQGFSVEDREKLSRIEDLVDKVRDDLKAGDDDEEFTEKPETTAETLKILKQKTSELFEELKKTSRYSVSAGAIQSSNQIARLLKRLKI